MLVSPASAKWLSLLLHLTSVVATRHSSAVDGGANSCHVTQTGTGCRYELSLLPLDGGGASCGGRRRHGNVTSLGIGDDVIVLSERFDDAVVKVTRTMKQLSVRCLRHLRQIKTELHKVRAIFDSSRGIELHGLITTYVLLGNSSG